MVIYVAIENKQFTFALLTSTMKWYNMARLKIKIDFCYCHLFCGFKYALQGSVNKVHLYCMYLSNTSSKSHLGITNSELQRASLSETFVVRNTHLTSQDLLFNKQHLEQLSTNNFEPSVN